MSNSENFEWDENKNRENQAKHGVSFEQAQYAFADPNLIVLEDLRHSTREETRYLGVGSVENGILTVRFTCRANKIRIFGAGYWEIPSALSGTRDSMSRKTDTPKQTWETVEYTDSPELPDIEDLQIVDKEFLPRPEELVFRDTETEYGTVSLDKETAAFFKNKAKESGASYQTLVRSILKEYVARQSR